MLEQLFRGIVGIQKNSFIDFPGTASAVLFFGGCNLTCPYCHNRRILDTELEEQVDAEEAVAFLKKRKGLLDGVVITGGEPTLHAHVPELMSFLQRTLGYKVKLDSNGLNPAMVKSCTPDYFAMDLKAVPSKYQSLLGASVNVHAKLEESLEVVKSMGDRAEVRVTMAPGVVAKEDMDEMKELLTGVSKVYLQQFSDRGDILDRSFFSHQENFTKEHLRELADVIAPVVGDCFVR